MLKAYFTTLLHNFKKAFKLIHGRKEEKINKLMWRSNLESKINDFNKVIYSYIVKRSKIHNVYFTQIYFDYI